MKIISVQNIKQICWFWAELLHFCPIKVGQRTRCASTVVTAEADTHVKPHDSRYTVVQKNKVKQRPLFIIALRVHPNESPLRPETSDPLE